MGSKVFELKHQIVLGTYVREKWGEIPRERTFKLKSLKAWGFDLLTGMKDGKFSYFVSDSDLRRKVGDKYTEDGISYEIEEMVKSLPKGVELRASVVLEETRPVIEAWIRDEKGTEFPLFKVHAGELLITYFKKKKLHKLVESILSSGLTTEFVKHRGTEGKPVKFDELPPAAREALRTASKVHKDLTGVGRFTLVYFGKNKNRKHRYWMNWILPTLYLFDIDIAEKVNSVFEALDN